MAVSILFIIGLIVGKVVGKITEKAARKILSKTSLEIGQNIAYTIFKEFHETYKRLR